MKKTAIHATRELDSVLLVPEEGKMDPTPVGTSYFLLSTSKPTATSLFSKGLRTEVIHRNNAYLKIPKSLTKIMGITETQIRLCRDIP